MALHGKSVQQSCPGEERMVTRRQYARHDDGVDEASRDVGADHLEDDGEGRGAGVFGVEVRVVVRDVQADEEDGEDAGGSLAGIGIDGL